MSCLSTVFDVALAGGGAKSINFQELAADLAEITFEYPFRIPPYFALVIRAISVLEGIALVGNPNFAIIDEAYPYIARRLLTDRSPRLRAALRYMIYGKDDEFDAENLIDMLQALEKFGSIRDDGDGSAFKVDGVRGSKALGQAGDFSGSQKVDTSDRDTDIDGGRFRVTMNDSAITVASQQQAQPVVGAASDERTVREALQFFFGSDGEVLREFMLEEIVNVVDASSRDAVQSLIKSIGLDNLPLPSIIRALSPELNDSDRRMVQQIRRLIQFLLGDFEAVGSTQRIRKLVPTLREYAVPLRDFGLLLIARLTEKNLSRGMRWLVENRARSTVLIAGAR
jgi:aarF domain-containing kinase